MSFLPDVQVDPKRYTKKGEDLEEYVGQYGHYAMGNATIHNNVATQRLEAVYGTFTRVDLIPVSLPGRNLTHPDRFIGVIDEPLFFFPPVIVSFGRGSDGKVISLVIPILLPDVPPV